MQKEIILNYVGISPKKLSKKELEEQIYLAKTGCPFAYEKILAHKHSYICHIMKEFFIQGSEPQDVYQECAIKLVNIIEKYDVTKGTFDAFSNSSIRKHIITSINKEKTKKRKVLNECYSLNDETKNNEGESISFLDTVTESSDSSFYTKDSFFDLIEKDYEEYLISRICSNLSEMESKIFVLRFIENYSYKEIAEKLSLFKISNKNKKILDQKAVDNAIWRSKPKIKKVLEEMNIKYEDIFSEIEQKNGENNGRIHKKIQVRKSKTKRV